MRVVVRQGFYCTGNFGSYIFAKNTVPWQVLCIVLPLVTHNYDTCCEGPMMLASAATTRTTTDM